MPLKNAIRYPLPLTPAQHTALLQVAGAGNAAQYIRSLIAADCSAKGIAWPDNLVKRGKYSRQNESKDDVV